MNPKSVLVELLQSQFVADYAPVLVILHDRVLYAYWFVYGLGLLVSAATALWLSSRRGLPFWKIWLLCLVLVIAAFVGARTLSLIEHGLPYNESSI